MAKGAAKKYDFKVIVGVNQTGDASLLAWDANEALELCMDGIGTDLEELGFMDPPTDAGVYLCTVSGWYSDEDESVFPILADSHVALINDEYTDILDGTIAYDG